ncbi:MULTISPECIES: hypothetical protein [Bacillus cereus group]|uniref:hypothetical protein n=1 Tax=Bacillus cereus group TaxID=86661 RepID=UPI001F5794AF|nr:hypothetical protein [Bacillus cereus group sp. BfR-BA-01522]
MINLEPYHCCICDTDESVEIEIDDFEERREVCMNCGYVHFGAADPWEIEENEKIEKWIKESKMKRADS